MTRKLKLIENLVPDIKNLLLEGKELSDEEAAVFGKRMSSMIQKRLKRRSIPNRGTLRMSNIGKPARQLWYEVNIPSEAEPLHPNTLMKFLIGDVVEEVLIFLAEHTGHRVEGMQDELELHGIVGHRDVVIDGVTVDVKSASPYSFEKFREGLKPEQDAFAYLTQINSYMEAGKDDPLVVDKSRGAFLAVQKVSGDIVLDIHEKSGVPLKDIYEYKKEMVDSEEIPERCFEPEPMGKSGNMKLGVNCSYCAFKNVCWPNLRTFLYKTGPVYLTHVEREPDVFEAV